MSESYAMTDGVNNQRPGVDDESGESKGCWTQSDRRVDGATRRQVALTMKTASRLTTERSSVMTTRRRRLMCDFRDG